jgi:hypothetical protein
MILWHNADQLRLPLAAYRTRKMERNNAIIKCAIIACLASVALGRDAAADPLSQLMPAKPGESACFVRVYDEAHLAKHKAQATKSVILSFKYEGDQPFPTLRVMLSEKSEAKPFYIVGGCAWSEHANRDINGRRLISAFNQEAGLDCHAIAGLSSAEEGGDFPIELAPDGSSLVLYLFDGIAAFAGPDQTKDANPVKLGPEDLIFRLDRAAKAECSALEQAVQSQ